MGRYYAGDISGKFWFGIQDSDDASFFGGYVEKPNYLNNEFYKEDLPDIKSGLKHCKEALKDYAKKIDKYMKREKGYYTHEQLGKELEVSESKLNSLLAWYARKELGEKILKQVKKTGECIFEAEF